MIYKTIEDAKADFNYLVNVCTHEYFINYKPHTGRIVEFDNRLVDIDDKFILEFYKSLLEEFNIKTTNWEDNTAAYMLPAIAFVPNKGARIFLEFLPDGSYKTEGQDGLEYFDAIPKGTKFISLRMNKQTNHKISAISMLRDVAMKQKYLIVYAAIASFGINFLALGTSLYSMQVYDRVIPTHGISTLVALSIGVMIAIFLELIVKIARSSILDVAAKNMDIEYSHNIFDKFLKIRCDALPKSIGILSGQLQSYASVRAFISSAALYLIIDFPLSMFFLVVIVLLGGMELGIAVFLFLIVSILTGVIFRKKIDSLSKTSSIASHKKLGLLVETVENAETVKATSNGWKIQNKWNTLTLDGIDDDMEIKHYSEISGYVAVFFQQISYVALIIIGAYLVSTTDRLTMGALIAVTILSGRVLSPIAMLPNLFVQWGKAKIAVEDLDRVFAYKSDNEGINRPLSYSITSADLICNNIKFAYNKDSLIVKTPMLKIAQGERLGILGMIGTGKSTLLKILGGLYMPQEGAVSLNGVDMQQVSRETIGKTIGYLPQNIKLFSGTLRENLTLGMIGINDEQILEAAKTSSLIALINSLPQGLDAIIPEGGESVSSGQKQMIALTRMIILNPKIWLLDEPTANMDEMTERYVLDVINRCVGKDSTLVIISHKPIAFGIVNRLIVMNQNGIVMDGSKEAVFNQINNISQNLQGKI